MCNSYNDKNLKSSKSTKKPKQNRKSEDTVLSVSYRFDERESTALDTTYFALFEYLTTNTPVIELINRVKYNNL